MSGHAGTRKHTMAGMDEDSKSSAWRCLLQFCIKAKCRCKRVGASLWHFEWYGGKQNRCKYQKPEHRNWCLPAVWPERPCSAAGVVSPRVGLRGWHGNMFVDSSSFPREGKLAESLEFAFRHAWTWFGGQWILLRKHHDFLRELPRMGVGLSLIQHHAIHSAASGRCMLQCSNGCLWRVRAMGAGPWPLESNGQSQSSTKWGVFFCHARFPQSAAGVDNRTRSSFVDDICEFITQSYSLECGNEHLCFLRVAKRSRNSSDDATGENRSKHRHLRSSYGSLSNCPSLAVRFVYLQVYTHFADVTRPSKLQQCLECSTWCRIWGGNLVWGSAKRRLPRTPLQRLLNLKIVAAFEGFWNVYIDVCKFD